MIPFNNEIDFAFASKEHGPWVMRVGYDGIYMPIYANNRYINVILNNDDAEMFEVSYDLLLKDWLWMDGTNCGQEIKNK